MEGVPVALAQYQSTNLLALDMYASEVAVSLNDGMPFSDRVAAASIFAKEPDLLRDARTAARLQLSRRSIGSPPNELTAWRPRVCGCLPLALSFP